MPITLPDIVAQKRAELAACPPVVLLPEKLPLAAKRFELALRDEALKLITEIKPASPSAGTLKATLDLPNILESYNRYAAAISVLTDRTFFKGSYELLSEVVRNSPLPVLCKDFILTSGQVYQARLAGAEAVLLMVKILTDAELLMLQTCIQELGMTPVVEIQNEEELDRAMKLNPSVLLINNRNLETFEISLGTTRTLAPRIPKTVITISASGIQNRSEIDALLPYCSRFLIGTALMQAGNLSDMLGQLSMSFPPSDKYSKESL